MYETPSTSDEKLQGFSPDIARLIRTYFPNGGNIIEHSHHLIFDPQGQKDRMLARKILHLSLHL